MAICMRIRNPEKKSENKKISNAVLGRIEIFSFYLKLFDSFLSSLSSSSISSVEKFS